MEYPYPLTVIADRYSGVYSDGKFTAWNLHSNDVPKEIHGDDTTCGEFWDKFGNRKTTIYGKTVKVGKGNTPSEAIQNLISKL